MENTACATDGVQHFYFLMKVKTRNMEDHHLFIFFKLEFVTIYVCHSLLYCYCLSELYSCSVCVRVCVTTVQRGSRVIRAPWWLADIDPCGRLCPHNDIFRGFPALNSRSTISAELAVAMQQFVAGSIQVGPEWRAAVRRRRRFESVFWTAGGSAVFLQQWVSCHYIWLFESVTGQSGPLQQQSEIQCR